MEKRKLIGGVFGLPDCAGERDQDGLPALQQPHLKLVNGRSALYVLSVHREAQRAWVPAFLCDAVVSALQKAGVDLRFYPVSEDLQVPPESWLQEILPGDFLVMIDYFGFPSDRDIMKEAQGKGAVVVEDASQALFTAGDTRADYVVYSLRKFLGVPDGGILSCGNGHALPVLPLAPCPVDWWLKAFTAALERREYDLYEAEGRWFELFRESEAEAPCGAFAMSEFSQALLQRCFDFPANARQRRNNYQRLLTRLRPLALFPELPPGVVPLGFPIRLRNRDAVRRALFHERIFPPIHWPIAGVVPSELKASHTLAADVLTLVCDQRYDAADMERTADIVLRTAEVS